MRAEGRGGVTLELSIPDVSPGDWIDFVKGRGQPGAAGGDGRA